MNTTQAFLQKVKNGALLTKEEALLLSQQPLDQLCAAADALRVHICGNTFELCSIINGKSGQCSENCKFCGQSSHFGAASKGYPLLEQGVILHQAQHNAHSGILRFSIVTSGRTLTNDEIDALCGIYRKLKQTTQLSLCASHGLLTYAQLVKLKEAGVTRYHNNLETSRRHFPNICTTHTYDDKIRTIKYALQAGLEVCSGGIIGLGETMEDRIDMALTLRTLGIVSIPVNVLDPIPGTPFAKRPRVTEEELLRTVSVFRFLIPNGAIRLAGGRSKLPDKGKTAFEAGANAAISGNMLTTGGITVREDLTLLRQLGFTVNSI